MKRLAVIGVLAALAAAGSGVGMSSAAFTAHSVAKATISAASDWTGPSVSITSPSDGATFTSSSPTLFGAAGTGDGDSSTVSFTLFSGSSASGTPVLSRSASRIAGFWYVLLSSLADGTYTMLVTQTDADGNTGRATRTFTIDSTDPTLRVGDRHERHRRHRRAPRGRRRHHLHLQRGDRALVAAVELHRHGDGGQGPLHRRGVDRRLHGPRREFAGQRQARRGHDEQRGCRPRRQLRHGHGHVQRDDDPERRRQVLLDRARVQRQRLEAALERREHLEADLDAEVRPDRPASNGLANTATDPRRPRCGTSDARASAHRAGPLAIATLALGTAAWAATGDLPLRRLPRPPARPRGERASDRAAPLQRPATAARSSAPPRWCPARSRPARPTIGNAWAVMRPAPSRLSASGASGPRSRGTVVDLTVVLTRRAPAPRCSRASSPRSSAPTWARSPSGATRRYRFVLAYPNGLPAVSTTRSQGATTSVQLAWDAVAHRWRRAVAQPDARRRPAPPAFLSAPAPAPKGDRRPPRPPRRPRHPTPRRPAALTVALGTSAKPFVSKGTASSRWMSEQHRGDAKVTGTVSFAGKRPEAAADHRQAHREAPHRAAQAARCRRQARRQAPPPDRAR